MMEQEEIKVRKAIGQHLKKVAEAIMAIDIDESHNLVAGTKVLCFVNTSGAFDYLSDAKHQKDLIGGFLGGKIESKL